MALFILNRGGGVDTSDANVTPATMLTGYSAYVDEAKIEGSMPNRGAVDITLAANGSYTIPDGWHNGSGRVHQSLTEQAGSTITPGTSNKLAVPAGRWVTGNVYVVGDNDLSAGNIKENVNIFGIKGTFVGTNCRDANAGAAQILTGYSGYVNQAKVSGTMPNRGAVDTSIGANGSYTIPNGYHNGSGKVKQSLTEQAGWSITPGTERKLACSSGRWVIGDIWCSAAPNLVPSNIKEGVTIFGVTGTFTG